MNKECNMNNELYHHGILGQRWGIRRYQNSDGTLTEAGKERLGRGKRKVNIDKNGNVQKGQEGTARSRIHEEISKDYQGVANISNRVGDISRSSRYLVNNAANRERQRAMTDMDLSNMSNAEIQAAISRMNLERNYRQLSTEQVGAGKTYLSDTLDTVGTVVGIGASMAMIAAELHKLKS